MISCREAFEHKYDLPAGVVYLNGNYTNVVPEAAGAAKKVNRRWDVFRCAWLMSRELQRGREVNKFFVRQYSKEEGPIIKGNGFDGLRIGECREEAQDFVDFINELR